MKVRKLKRLKPLARTVLFGGAIVGSGAAAFAADDATMKALTDKVDALETLIKKEGLMPSGPTQTVKAMSDINISGFVQASYFYNTEHPSDGVSDAYLWNASNNSFSINKVKVTIASAPVERSGSDWDAAFRTSLIWGEDSPNLNTGSPGAGFEALREAYVELNVPIGTGLNVKMGQLISLLNWESGDGGAANPNFSQGNQWWFTGNGPSAGVQLGYTFSDAVSLNVRVQNGMFAGPVDVNNDGKAVVASLNIKPCSKAWVNLIGWYSQNEFNATPTSSSTDVSGFSAIGGVKVNDKLGTGFEFDYFHFDSTVDADIWSIGGWVWYDFNSKAGIAFRADYIGSPDGVLGPPMRGPASAITTTDTDGSLGSLTLTLNLKPTPNIKIQPEIRYDYTTFNNGLDGEESRFIIGAGISYLF